MQAKHKIITSLNTSPTDAKYLLQGEHDFSSYIFKRTCSFLKQGLLKKNYYKASKLDCELAHPATFLLHKAQVHSWHKKMLSVYKEAQLHARFSYDI